MAGMLNAVDANLAAFKSRGGKLIIYHGWNDPAIPAVNTINYYNSVIGKMGQQNADSFVRVYMVPGMQHCAGGPGADSFGSGISPAPTDSQHSLELSLEQWVEKGIRALHHHRHQIRARNSHPRNTLARFAPIRKPQNTTAPVIRIRPPVSFALSEPTKVCLRCFRVSPI